MASKKKSIVRYFEQKDIVRPIALGVLILGIASLWIGIGWIGYILAMIGIPVGLVTYIVSAAKTVSQDEVPSAIERGMREYDLKFKESKVFRTEVVKHPEPFETETHIYDGARYFKKAKNGNIMSDIYTKAHIFFTESSTIILKRTLSLCELDELTQAGVTDTLDTLPFSDIKEAKLEEKELEVILTDTKKPHRIKVCELVIAGHDGERLRFPVRNDHEMTSYCEQINRKTRTNN